jgi:hypothetical protein
MNTMLLFAALLSAPLLAPKAPGQSADAKTIKATHAKLLAAFKAKNAGAVKSLFTKGFTQTANGMTFNRDQAVAQMVQGAGSSKVDWTMSGLEVSGDKATYTSNFTFETTSVDNAGMLGPKGKTHKMGGAGVQKVQMVKESGKWLYNHLEAVSLKMTMDGKLFNPQAPPPSPNKPAHK